MATTEAVAPPRATLIDSNVLIDVLSADADWEQRSIEAMTEAKAAGPLVINQIVYAELAVRFQVLAELDRELASLDAERTSLPWEAAMPSARAFSAYRRAGGTRRSPLPDFYIGAHAEVQGLRLLTRDEQRYRTYFPDVELLVP